jgi:hypothetical protein
MPGPIIIKDPKLVIQPLTPAGDPSGLATEVSEDVTSVELGVDQDIGTIKTFTGSFRIPGEVSSTATVSIVLTADTETNWAALVGQSVEIQVYDREDATKYRVFQSEISYDPSLYGTTTPGEAREHDMELPVFGDVSWAPVTP